MNIAMTPAYTSANSVRYRRLTIPITALLLAGCVAPMFFHAPLLSSQEFPAVPKLPLETYEAAVRDQIQTAYQAAVDHPHEAEASGVLGMLLYAHEQYEFADPCFRRALALAPGDGRWAYYLGRTLANLRRCDQALASLKEAIRINPGYLPARLKYGECLLEAARTDESRKVFQSVSDDHPDDPVAHYWLGKIDAGGRNFASALDHLRRACDLFPGFGAAHFLLAGVHRDLGETAAAQDELVLYQEDKLGWPPTPDPLLRAILDLKTGAAAHLRRGIDLAEANQLEAAALEHEQALLADSKLVQAHINLIRLYALLDKPEQAENHFRAAVALDPNRAEAHYNLGVLMLRQNRNAEAADAFRRALELNPSYVEAHNNYGFLLMMAGKLDEAAEQYQAALAGKPDFRSAHFNLGRILAQQGKIQQAIDHFLMTLTPDDEEAPRCLYALGAAYARSGNRESALRYMKEGRRKAARFGQSTLLDSIDKDLRLLEEMTKSP
jgi:tetratricopeptide (TPR) repeat protein